MAKVSNGVVQHCTLYGNARHYSQYNVIRALHIATTNGVETFSTR